MRYLPISFLFALISCNPFTPTEKAEVAQTIPVDNGTIKGNVPIDAYVDSIQFIKLKLPPNTFIKWADKIIEHNHVFYLSDKQSNKLYIFNKKGEYVRHVGEIGEGPGEYSHLNSFFIDPYRNEILLYDNAKIIYYDKNGIYRRERKYKLYFDDRIIPNADNTLFFCEEYEQPGKGSNNAFYLTNSEDSVYRTLEKTKSQSECRIRGVLKNFSFYQKKVLFCQSFNDVICEITNTGRKPRYIIKFKKNAVPEEFMNNPKIYDHFDEAIRKSYPFLDAYFVENAKGCYFSYIYNKSNMYFVIYDKKTNTTTVNAASVTFKGFPIPLPGMWSEKSFISFMPPEEVGFFRDVSKLVADNTSEEDAQEDANQTLMVFKMKEN